MKTGKKLPTIPSSIHRDPLIFYRYRHTPTGLYIEVNRTLTQKGNLYKQRKRFFRWNIIKVPSVKEVGEFKHLYRKWNIITTTPQDWEEEVVEFIIREAKKPFTEIELEKPNLEIKPRGPGRPRKDN